jgi:cobalamin biosynthesis Co2+ chelatase CbiK
MQVKVIYRHSDKNELLNDVKQFYQDSETNELVVEFEDGSENRYENAFAIFGSMIDDSDQ